MACTSVDRRTSVQDSAVGLLNLQLRRGLRLVALDFFDLQQLWGRNLECTCILVLTVAFPFRIRIRVRLSRSSYLSILLVAKGWKPGKYLVLRYSNTFGYNVGRTGYRGVGFLEQTSLLY